MVLFVNVSHFVTQMYQLFLGFQNILQKNATISLMYNKIRATRVGGPNSFFRSAELELTTVKAEVLLALRCALLSYNQALCNFSCLLY